MNVDDSNVAPSPIPKYNFMSWILFGWLERLMWMGFKRPLDTPDMFDLREAEKSHFVHPEFGHTLKQQQTEKKNPSTTKALLKAFGFQFWAGGILCLLAAMCNLASPIIAGFYLTSYRDTDNFPFMCYMWCLIIFGIQLLGAFLSNYHYHLVGLAGLKAKSALIAEIYKKSLHLSCKARQTISTGEIVNLISMDIQKIADVTAFFHVTWTGVVTIIGALGLVAREMGLSTVAGIVVFLLLVPCFGALSRLWGGLRMKVLKTKDSRIKFIGETFKNISIIKYYAWENIFIDKLIALRKSETDDFKRITYVRALMTTLMSTSPLLSLLLIIIVHVAWMGKSLSAASIFPVMAYFNILKNLLIVMPMNISFILDAKISMQRIQKFLMAEEVAPGSHVSVAQSQYPVEIYNGNFSWDAEADSTRGDTNEGKLTNINLEVKKGSLCSVVGPTGSGKTSLLSALLGNMYKVSGEVRLDGSIAYCPQEAWIINGTIRDNVLFGLPFDEDRYYTTLRVCALDKDIVTFELRDETDVGDKGSNLSGGQRQRVNLARAVYSDADIILLDDSLSALDAKVSDFVFKECINGFLKNKTRIFVSNQLQFLHDADKIVYLRDGQIAEQGPYAELQQRDDGEFAQLLRDFLVEHADIIEEDEVSNEPEDEGLPEVLSPQKVIPKLNLTSLSLVLEDTLDSGFTQRSASKTPKTGRGNGTLRKGSTLVLKNSAKRQSTKNIRLLNRIADLKKRGNVHKDEEKITGKLTSAVFHAYFKAAGGYMILFVCLVLFVLAMAAMTFNAWWITVWTSDMFGLSVNNLLFIYIGITLSHVVLQLFREFLLPLCLLNAATKLHNDAFKTCVKAPRSFFEDNPVGRLLLRFSKDQEFVDNVLILAIQQFLGTTALLVFTVGILGYSTPWLLLAVAPALIAFIGVQEFYRRTSRELKRLESHSKSPLLAHLSETLAGISTIIAYKAQERFLAKTHRFTDFHQRVYFILNSSKRWLNARLDIISALVVFLTWAIPLIQAQYGSTVSASVVGLSIIYSLQITLIFSNNVRTLTDAEGAFNSVERILYYITDIKPEIVVHRQLPKDWPHAGALHIQNLSVRYRPQLPAVLYGISASISAGEKIGIVGRTGAGKSSLISALFRTVEPSCGTIMIDGIDYREVNLEDLRSRIAIIPQEPVLFSGTIRFNLDPCNEYTDQQIWDVLERVHLEKLVKSFPDNIGTMVTESGNNFSLGQKQLICMGRAILKKARVVVMDEATASIDVETDAIIQKTIFREFKQATTLIIAHRLNAVLDCDRIIVMANGKIAEFGTPISLCSNSKSIFASMLNNAKQTLIDLLNRKTNIMLDDKSITDEMTEDMLSNRNDFQTNDNEVSQVYQSLGRITRLQSLRTITTLQDMEAANNAIISSHRELHSPPSSYSDRNLIDIN